MTRLLLLVLGCWVVLLGGISIAVRAGIEAAAGRGDLASALSLAAPLCIAAVQLATLTADRRPSI